MDSYSSTFTIRRLWWILGLSMVVMFGVLLYYGQEIYQKAPPIPVVFQQANGEVVFTRDQIMTGQNVWQSLGGMQQGSIWGHGGYLAPDWTADWLRREAEAMLVILAEHKYLTASKEYQQDVHEAALRREMRRNTYDPNSERVTLSAERVSAINIVAEHYRALFQGDEDYLELRRDYAFPLHQSLKEDEARALSAFVFWSAWAAVTERPDNDISYTSNWPHDPLVGNVPSAGVFMWSMISILLLLAGIGWIVWYYARQYDDWAVSRRQWGLPLGGRHRRQP
ncbi:MAG: hypothetical protein ACE37D_19200, partial [Pseudomonadales bacterium]